MAVAQVTKLDGKTRHYRIRTIDEKSAELIVIRTGDDLADYRAEATVGLFQDHKDRARELVEQFELHLSKLHDRRLAAIMQ